MKKSSDHNSAKNRHPDHEFDHSVSANPEIEQPQSPSATPSFPQEMPIRQE
jgi:hypothetical protein